MPPAPSLPSKKHEFGTYEYFEESCREAGTYDPKFTSVDACIKRGMFTLTASEFLTHSTRAHDAGAVRSYCIEMENLRPHLWEQSGCSNVEALIKAYRSRGHHMGSDENASGSGARGTEPSSPGGNAVPSADYCVFFVKGSVLRRREKDNYFIVNRCTEDVSVHWCRRECDLNDRAADLHVEPGQHFTSEVRQPIFMTACPLEEEKRKVSFSWTVRQCMTSG